MGLDATACKAIHAAEAAYIDEIRKLVEDQKELARLYVESD